MKSACEIARRNWSAFSAKLPSWAPGSAACCCSCPHRCPMSTRRLRRSSRNCASATAATWRWNHDMPAGWRPTPSSGTGVLPAPPRTRRPSRVAVSRVAGRACATTACTVRHVSTIQPMQPSGWSAWLMNCADARSQVCLAGASSTTPPAALRPKTRWRCRRCCVVERGASVQRGMMRTRPAVLSRRPAFSFSARPGIEPESWPRSGVALPSSSRWSTLIDAASG